MNSRHWVIIPAAGSGSRMGNSLPKQYLPLAGEPMLAQTLRLFTVHARIAGVVLALADGDAYWSGIDPELRGQVRTVTGGAERSDSVRAGMAALQGIAAETDWVLVHDAARPCLRPADLDRLLDTLADDPVGGLLAVPVHDTLKRADAIDGRVVETVPRAGLWQAQTPQMFRYGLLVDALEAAAGAGDVITDEAMAMERRGHVVRLVAGHADNLKVTRPEDLPLAAWLLGQIRGETA